MAKVCIDTNNILKMGSIFDRIKLKMWLFCSSPKTDSMICWKEGYQNILKEKLPEHCEIEGIDWGAWIEVDKYDQNQ